MPLISLRTNLSAIEGSEGLLKALSLELAEATGKPEAYVMTLLEVGLPMTFAGSSDPCAYIEIKSIGALKPSVMSSRFCTLVQKATGVMKERIYIGFDDVPASSWRWNGRTFG